MKKILAVVLLMLYPARIYAASPYYDLSMSTAMGKATMRLSGPIRLSANASSYASPGMQLAADANDAYIDYGGILGRLFFRSGIEGPSRVTFDPLGNISATAYYGDGSHLTGLGSVITGNITASSNTFTGINTFRNIGAGYSPHPDAPVSVFNTYVSTYTSGIANAVVGVLSAAESYIHPAFGLFGLANNVSDNSAGDLYGVYGKTRKTGVGGGITHAYGTYGDSSENNTHNYGAYGHAGSPYGSGNNYGVYGVADGASGLKNNYGVYGKALNGFNNYAGYFEGNTYVSGELGVGSNDLLVSGGKVGIGTVAMVSKLNVAGTIRSTEGGFVFPDGTTQASAGISAGADLTFTGNDYFTNYVTLAKNGNYTVNIGTAGYTGYAGDGTTDVYLNGNLNFMSAQPLITAWNNANIRLGSSLETTDGYLGLGPQWNGIHVFSPRKLTVDGTATLGTVEASTIAVANTLTGSTATFTGTLTAGTIYGNLPGYVPYTGATGTVNLNDNDIYVGNLHNHGHIYVTRAFGPTLFLNSERTGLDSWMGIDFTSAGNNNHSIYSFQQSNPYNPSRLTFLGRQDAASFLFCGGNCGVQNPTPGLVITSGNKVGIGTANPSMALDVIGIIKSSGSTNSLMFGDRVNSANSWEWYSSDGTAGLYKNHNTAGTVLSISPSGRLGVGIATPASVLHVQGSDGRQLTLRSSNGYQTGMQFLDSGGSVIANIDAGTTSNVGLRFDSGKFSFVTGQVGIGTTAPAHLLDVYGSGAAVRVNGNASASHMYMAKSGTNYAQFAVDGTDTYLDYGGSTGRLLFRAGVEGTIKAVMGTGGELTSASLAGTGNRAVYSDSTGQLTNSSSDARLKKDVVSLSTATALGQTLQLRPVAFHWDTSLKRAESLGNQQELGLIAQEVEGIVPQVVGENADGYKSLDYAKLVPVLIGAVQAQQAMIDGLKARIAALDAAGGN